jgi:hypothetical protein
MPRIPTPTDILCNQFLQNASLVSKSVEPIKVLRARAYQIKDSNVLIRASLLGKSNRYFFGLNYIHVEEMANLDNPFIAFICGSIENSVIFPAKILFDYLPSISHDRNGEYKIVFDKDLNLVLNGRNNRINCKEYIQAWDLVANPPNTYSQKSTVEESLHNVLQGRLLEIGNIRGYQTFSPNKSKLFNGKPLSSIATLSECPSLQFSEYTVLRQIDVLWFRERGANYIPECGFEIELSTGTWSGVGRLATLIDYANTRLFVISDDMKKYNQVMNAFSDFQLRYNHVQTSLVSDLYSAELGLRDLRVKIGIL